MTNTKQNDTHRLIAERIAAEHIGAATYYAEQRRLCADAIEAALNAERERCAKIAEMNADERCRENARHDIGICGKQIAFQIRHAIRGKD